MIMSQEFFDRLSDVAKRPQEFWQRLAALNVKTLQEASSYFKPEEVFGNINMKRPEEMVEKQFAWTFSAGHKALDYMQQAFEIFEQSMLSAAQDVKTAAQDIKSKSQKSKDSH